MTLNPQTLRREVQKRLPEAERFLCELIRFPSVPGHETEAMQYAARAFEPLADVDRIALNDALRDDPDYSDPIPDLRYEGRFNLRIRRPGAAGGGLLLNTHLDVVPPSEGMASPWHPRTEQELVFGRGACDAKGQAAVMFLLFLTLHDLGLDLPRDLTAHLVVEEENGGNGTLAMAQRGETADACIVMEPTQGRILTSIRGAVWFRLTFTGKAGHSGQAEETRSALLMARDAVALLEKYHDDLLNASRGIPLFDSYPDPMPLTFGRLSAGNWPASAPSRAVLEGVLGLLPNRTRQQVCDEMRAVLAAQGDAFLAANTDLHFMYRHDCSVLDPGHRLPRGLLAAARDAGTPTEIGAMTASCDAWLYNNRLRIPTVVYGPGTLKVAHGKDERISMEDVATAATTLLCYLLADQRDNA